MYERKQMSLLASMQLVTGSARERGAAAPDVSNSRVQRDNRYRYTLTINRYKISLFL